MYILDERLISNVDFFTSEGFGVNVPPRCKQCTDMAKRCKECKFEIHELSRNSQQELAIMRENATLDPIKKQWTTKYPFKSDPNDLEKNYEQVVRIMEKQEDRMLKKNVEFVPKFCEQFQDLLDREVLVEISDEDRKSYKRSNKLCEYSRSVQGRFSINSCKTGHQFESEVQGSESQ